EYVAETRLTGCSGARAPSGCSAGVLVGAVLLVRIDEPTRGARADGGSGESTGDRTVTPSPVPHGATATQDQDCDDTYRNSAVTHGAPSLAWKSECVAFVARSS